MPDSKHIKWADSFGQDAERDAVIDDAKAETSVDGSQPAANDADGWQQYRRWISKAPAPRGRRSGLDPSLYSWKGYRDWSDKVKRGWMKERNDD